jgi:hypothetical protein
VSPRDHRDLVIEALADELAAANESRDAYRELCQVALERLATLTATVERLTTRVHELLDERRRDVAA